MLPFVRYKCSGASQVNQDTDDKHLVFTNLVNHLRHLVAGPDSVADTTKKAMRSRLVKKDATVRTDGGRTLDRLELNIWEDICDLVPL